MPLQRWVHSAQHKGSGGKTEDLQWVTFSVIDMNEMFHCEHEIIGTVNHVHIKPYYSGSKPIHDDSWSQLKFKHSCQNPVTSVIVSAIKLIAHRFHFSLESLMDWGTNARQIIKIECGECEQSPWHTRLRKDKDLIREIIGNRHFTFRSQRMLPCLLFWHKGNIIQLK